MIIFIVWGKRLFLAAWKQCNDRLRHHLEAGRFVWVFEDSEDESDEAEEEEEDSEVRAQGVRQMLKL